MAVFTIVSDIIGIPLILSPLEAGRELLTRIRDFTVFGAKLLTEFDSAGGANFHTLAAGNTVILVDVCTIG